MTTVNKKFYIIMASVFVVMIGVLGTALYFFVQYIDNQTIEFGTPYEEVIQTKGEPHKVFALGEQEEFLYFLKENGIIFSEYSAGFLPTTIIGNPEYFGKVIISMKERPFGQEPIEVDMISDLFPIRGRVALYTSWHEYTDQQWVTAHYFDEQNNWYYSFQGGTAKGSAPFDAKSQQ
mgnify:CR=1 FL=1